MEIKLKDVVIEEWNRGCRSAEGKIVAVQVITDADASKNGISEDCLKFAGKIYPLDQNGHHDGPEFPLHPNCKCRYEPLTNDDFIRNSDFQSYNSGLSWEKVSSGKLAGYMCHARYSISEMSSDTGYKYVPDVLKKKLSEIVRLEYAEFNKWAQNIKFVKQSGIVADIYVEVPNTWICANLLQGGTWYWDMIFVNPGGVIGEVTSALGTWGMNEIKCTTVAELKTAFNSNKKAVWGFVLYSHGNKKGYIGPVDGDKEKGTAMNQNELMSLVDAQGFKLAKLYLMQCDSGSNGLFFIEKSYDSLCKMKREKLTGKDLDIFNALSKENKLKLLCDEQRKYYSSSLRDTPHVKVEDCFFKDNNIFIVFSCEWGVEWGKRTVAGKADTAYQGVNAIGLDWGWLEKNPPEKE